LEFFGIIWNYFWNSIGITARLEISIISPSICPEIHIPLFLKVGNPADPAILPI
jgi:hypothetical protein